MPAAQVYEVDTSTCVVCQAGMHSGHRLVIHTEITGLLIPPKGVRRFLVDAVFLDGAIWPDMLQ